MCLILQIIADVPLPADFPPLPAGEKVCVKPQNTSVYKTATILNYQ